MQQLRTSAVKPRIKPWVDSFVPHDIDEDTFADYEANDPFIQTLILNLDGLLAGFKRAMTPANYDGLVAILTNEVTVQLEKAVLKSTCVSPSPNQELIVSFLDCLTGLAGSEDYC